MAENKPKSSNRRDVPEKRFRVYINRVPANMTEAKMKEIISSITPVKPNYCRLCLCRDKLTGDSRGEKYLLLEFERREPADAIHQKLHGKEPNNFLVRVQKREFFPFASAKTWGQPPKNSYERNDLGKDQNGASRMLASSSNEIRGFQGSFGSPPAQSSPMMGVPTLRRMTEGGQVCIGCGCVTQLNCSTCFTPFCSSFCMGKFCQPSHPYECRCLLVDPSSPMEMQVPSFNSWFKNWHRTNNAKPKFGECSKTINNNNSIVARGGGLRPKPSSLDSSDTASGGSTGSINNSLEESVQNLSLQDSESESNSKKSEQYEEKKQYQQVPLKNWKPNCASTPFFPSFAAPSTAGEPQQFVRHTAPPVFMSAMPFAAQCQMMGPVMPGSAMMQPCYVLLPPNQQLMMLPFDQQQQQWVDGQQVDYPYPYPGAGCCMLPYPAFN
ncbi:uncharacterized protein LOC135937206 [Cloeon dipterum]|uniref:uncharacterized protein LOC135937206 n=1 Tax=Cloeon dipterum TaxID=197152 RepID=UPI00321FA6D6